MDLISDFELLVAGTVILALVYVMAELRRRLRGAATNRAGPRKSSHPKIPRIKRVVVDGSNVMYWAGNGPSRLVLFDIIHSLKTLGFHPYIVFDANVGHLLSDTFLGDGQMAKLCGVDRKQVKVVDKGVVADGVILKYAKRHGVKVVSNDRYRDWSVQYPLVKQKGRMMRGTWKGGAAVWSKS